MWVYHLAHYGMNNGYAAQLVYAHFIQAISQIYLHVYLIVRNQKKLRYKDIYGDSLLRLTSWMGQTPHHRPAKTVFSNVPSNSDWQKCEPVGLQAGCRGAPLQGTVNNRSLVAGGVAFDILRCWKDVHLQTSVYSLQVKYKVEVTTTTESNGFNREPVTQPPLLQKYQVNSW